MTKPLRKLIRRLQLALYTLAIAVTAPALVAQPKVPLDIGARVNGYQDDFEGTTLKADWTPTGPSPDVYSVANGALHVETANGDPNHLLYTHSGYDNTTQEVLARIRFADFGTGDPARGGVGVAVDALSSQGINYHFRDSNSEGQSGRHLSFLDDFRAWGPGFGLPWQNNVWYWVRLRQEAGSGGGVTGIFSKVWLADGSTAEPDTWQSWNYVSSRTGFAGITAGSSSGTSRFDVDYILIKAAGLPEIIPAPSAFPLFTPGPVVITNQPANFTATQCGDATFSVACNGTPPYRFQWYHGGTVIPGATNDTYTVSAVQLADNGTTFKVVVGNTVNGVAQQATSRDAVLTVTPDTTPPALLGAVNNGGPDNIFVVFSEPVAPASATNLSNYRITFSGGVLPVLRAALSPDHTRVSLTTTGQVEEVTYTLTVNNIIDECSGSNPIVADSKATFTSHVFTPVDLGGATPAGHIVGASGGYDLSGGGSGLDGTADQAQFSYQPRSGDFDVKIRLDSLAASTAWAEAGLMARESTNSNSRQAAALATPSVSGSYFKARTTAGSASVASGSFPVNYPYTWLRLRRVGNQFSGYASFDGQNWTSLGSASIAMPASILLGFTVSSRDATASATASFREFADATGAVVGAASPSREPLGQSSRLTSLVISEIMYHPANIPGYTNNLEFIELFNTRDIPEKLGGYRIDGDVHYTFPANTVIPGGGFLVIAKSPADIQSLYGISGVLGPYSDSLPNDAGKVQLRNPVGAIFLEVNYDTVPPWPASADGAGHSLVLARPSFGENSPEAWAASDAPGGSPGRFDAITPNPVGTVVINEFLAHTDDPELDFIELYNHSNSPVDLSGCFLSDEAGTNKFTIPSGTKIPARGHVSFDQNQLGFSLKAEGETIYFRAADQRVQDAIRYEAQANGVSFGRYPDGAPVWRAQSQKTPGTANKGFRRSDIVINEIMYRPISHNEDDQYVEIYHTGTQPVDLSGWKFTAGIDFTFPTNTLMVPGAYFVVAKNAARLKTNYSNLGAGNLFGDFKGSLAKSGERLALSMPDQVISTNKSGVVTTNTIYVVASEVTYQRGGRWGQWSDGGGSSLELVDPRSDPTLAGNWADSDETSKAPWTALSYSGTVDNTSTTADQLQVLLQGAGECLIDDVQVLNASNANLIANPTFESNANGWTAEGTEDASSRETSEGFNSSRSYHVRAVDRGDNQVNRIRVPLTTPLSSGSAATIKARIRWLRGFPKILFRLRGNGLEAFTDMELPANPGTPGSRNSRYAGNNGAAVYDVASSPILPADREAVIVTARASDPDGLGSLSLKYRVDPATTYTSVAMLDDGTSGDAVAGDGIYSAAIPGQTAGTIAAYYVQATDGAASPLASVYPRGAPAQEYLVRFGESQPFGNLPVYRMWMTQAALNTWNTRNKLNNTPLGVTFVLGNQRVIQNAKALYAGSPYIAPGYCGPNCGRCGYSIILPEDDRFLGNTDLVLDWPGGHGGETTAIQEQMAYWIADRMGLPFSHRYFIHLHVNGVTDDQRNSIFEAVNQPAGDFIDAWSSKANDGDFYKIDRGFEFSDGGGLIADPMPTLQVFTTTGGVKKQARYRWNWNKRSTYTVNDYANIFQLVDAVNAASPEPYTALTDNIVNIDEWMGIFAVEHIINNFDSWGHDIAKNMYAYKPDNGKWLLYMFDLDWLMLVSPNGPGRYTASTGPLFSSSDPVVSRLYNHPPFRRAYFRAVQAAVDDPFLAANYEALMDAKYASLLANGVRYCDGQSLTPPTALKNWFRDRRTYLLSQLATVAANFTIFGSKTITTDSSPVTLSGTAPVAVASIQVNGIERPATWTSVNNWTLQVPVTQSSNYLVFTGHDTQGNYITGASNAVTVIYPGAAPSLPSVVINEWMAANTKTIADASGGVAKYDDWFELYNTGNSTVNLAGLYLTDTLANKLQFQIPPGYNLPPGGRLLVWADNEPEQNTSTGADLHVNFQLSRNGEMIGLFAADGTAIDQVTFGAQNDDISQGRCPDGSTNIVFLSSPSPRTANQCAPASPSFLPLSLKGNQLTVGWETAPGRTYRVEYKDDLNAAAWNPLGSTATAGGTSMSITVNIDAARQRFYRIVIVN